MRTDGTYRGRDRARREAQAEWEALALGLAAAAWWCRVELALLGGMVVVHVVLARWLGGPVAAAVVVGAVGALLAVRPVRHRIATVLHGARVRRAWDRAVLDAGAATGPFRGPRVLSVTPVAAGELLEVRVTRGASVAELTLAVSSSLPAWITARRPPRLLTALGTAARRAARRAQRHAE